MSKRNLGLSIFVVRSAYRKDVLLSLIDRPYQTQTQLLKKTSLKYRSHISRTMKELLAKKLIICENPDDANYKLYKPTEKGVRLKESIEKYDEE